MLDLDLSRQASKALKGLPAKHARQIAVRITALRHDPEPHDSRQMKGKDAAFRRVDVGEYRVIYRLAGGERNDSEVYRHFERMV